MKMVKEIIIYLDSFGTKYSFFTDRKPRLYTLFGGILTITSILLTLVIFIFYSRDDFRHLKPANIFSSIFSEKNREINVTNEKIWIPWRIVDYNNGFVNHTKLIYPKIYYYEGNRKSINDSFSFRYKLINYKLCNETSMKYKPEFYFIEVPLDKLYCIEMNNYNIGGSWTSLFLKYLKIDFYLCENGIDFDINNTKCTTYEKIYKYFGYKNSLKIEFFYPDVQFQPTNKNNSISISYKNYFYHINKHSNKIDRLYLRNHILSDDKGFLFKKIVNSSYWGYNSLIGDSYFTPGVNDLINEGSTSRVYSLNIYLEEEVMNYRRIYKKFITILLQNFPVLYISLFIFRTIAKFFKCAEKKIKMIEMLFENLQKKVRKNFTHNDFKAKNNYKNNYYYINNRNNYRNGFLNNNLVFLNENKYIFNDDNSSQLNNHSINSNKLDISKNFNYSNLIMKPSNYKTVIPQNKHIGNIENIDNIESNNQKFLNLPDNCKKSNNNSNSQANNSSKIFSRRKHLQGGKFERMESMANEYYYRKTVKGKKLFSYHFYFISAFLKSIDITKHHLCLSEKYIGVHTFICQMFDVSSYLQLLRQFQLVKNWYFKDEINLIERNQKLDMNAKDFKRNIGDCISNKNFIIFAQNN